MKKLIKVSLLFVSTLTIAGCRFFGNQSNVDKDKIQLTIGFWPQSSDKKDVAMYNAWKEKFELDNPQYQIIGEPYTYSKETIGTKFATNTLPMVYQTWFTEPETLKNSNYIRDITDILNEFGWADKLDDEMRETLTFDNKIYGVPRDGYGLGLLINKKTLGDCGLLPEDENGNYVLYNEDGSPAYPTTFQQIHDYSQVVVDNTAATLGLFLCSSNKNGGWQFSNYAWNYGATLQAKDSSGKWVANLNCDESVAAMEWIQQMKNDDLLYRGTSIVYDDWASAINEKVAMAVVGSDVLHLAATTGGVDMDDLAFVPMPTGDGTHHYSLYGGTPFVFDAKTTDDQVRGILKFFDYIGRSPSTSKTNIDAIKEGYEVAKNKNQPIIPKIMPWKNNDFLDVAKQLEEEYVSVNMDDYSPFFDSIDEYKHSEEPIAAQKMYEFLDDVIQSVLTNPDTANCRNLLTTANSKLQSVFDETVNA